MITELLDNELSLDGRSSYAAIIGGNPSAGARSPSLWNAAFRAHAIDAEMLPFDVQPDALEALLADLEADPRFLGGAVAVPHKVAAASWLGDRLTPGSQRAGAVNCLYRSRGLLHGANTDGEAAASEIEGHLDGRVGIRAAVLGAGGAGRAVASALTGVQWCTSVVVVVRTPRSVADWAAGAGVEVELWDRRGVVAAGADVVVNCTTVGSRLAGLEDETPLDEDEVAAAEQPTLYLDVVYDPAPTRLLRAAEAAGRATINGLGMNVEQAVLAYERAAPQPNGRYATRAAMLDAAR